MWRFPIIFTAFVALVLLEPGAAVAQSYQITNLVANTAGKARHTDSLLSNPWGLAYAPGGPFWISDEAAGCSTLYDGLGNPQPIAQGVVKVSILPASGTNSGTPTGIVYNGSSEFSEFRILNWPIRFLFATLDGTISGWYDVLPSHTFIGVTQPGASYTGLAITAKGSGNHLFAADAANNKVDLYDGSFNLVTSFTDTNIPSGFAPFGIQDIGGQVYVTYADTSGGSGGYIDVFGEDGSFVKRLAEGAPLDQPWGLAVAPADFGPLSGTLLVANNTTNGTINGFDLQTGAFVGTLSDSNSNAITISGLWGIEFGGGATNTNNGNGQTNQLFFTAGPNDTQGYFGMIQFKLPSHFTINLSAVPPAGGSVSGGGVVRSGLLHTVKASAKGGYRFVNWTQGTNVVSTSRSYQFIANGSETLTANFQQTFTLRLLASPSLGGSVSGGGTYDSGSGVVAIGNPKTGYVFKNWTQGTNVLSSAFTYGFTLGTNTILTGHFSKATNTQ